MKNEQSEFNKQKMIQDYLLGAMTSNERVDFEALLEESNELREDLDFSRRLIQVTQYDEVFEVRDIVRKAGQQYFADVKTKSNYTWLKLSGFVLLILITVGLIGFNGFSAYQAKDLSLYQSTVDLNLEPLELLLAFEEGENLNLTLGLAAYEKKNFKAAIPLLSKYFEATKDANIGLYLGISFLEEKKYTEALELLKTLEQEETLPMMHPVKWYLALAYYANGDIRVAKKFMKNIADSENVFKEKAQLFYEQNLN